jgi:hypothetical protein
VPNLPQHRQKFPGAGNDYVVEEGNGTIRKGYPALRILKSGPGFGFHGGQFDFNLTGPAARLVVVEASTDLVSWQSLWTNAGAGEDRERSIVNLFATARRLFP